MVAGSCEDSICVAGPLSFAPGCIHSRGSLSENCRNQFCPDKSIKWLYFSFRVTVEGQQPQCQFLAHSRSLIHFPFSLIALLSTHNRLSLLSHHKKFLQPLISPNHCA